MHAIRWRSSVILRRAAATLLIATMIIGSPVGAGAQDREDLRSYYPNRSLVRDDMYLEGFNHVSGSPERSVLWFDLERRGWFNQYNSAPDDPNTECHFDRLRWRNSVLRYHETHDSCGSTDRETVYSPGITLMPRRWTPGDEWSLSGSSEVTHSENGEVVCRGVNDWTATVLGWEEIHPGVEAIHVRSRQTTTWTEGHSSTGCSAGFVTNWQEDYFLLPDMPVDGGGTANGFKRSVGGNLDGGGDRWDVWFDYWAPMP